MSEEHDWDFFIAHASPDTTAAETLYELLIPNAKVFLDTQCLVLGDSWDVELALAQRRSLISVILISSETAAAYYEREEILVGIELSKSGGHRVVPVYLDSKINQTDIPYGLRRKHGITLANDISLKNVPARLLRTLDRHRDILAKRKPAPARIVDYSNPSLSYGDDVHQVEPKSPVDGIEGFDFFRRILASIFAEPRQASISVDKLWAIVSFVLTVVGLSGLANGVVEWREFFDYGVIRHYIEIRTWLMSFLPFRLPSWVGDYITLGLAISYPVKGIIAEAKKNIPSLEVRLKVANRFADKRRQAVEHATELRSVENARVERIEKAFGPQRLSEKDQLKYDKELGASRASIREQTLTIDEFDHLESEARSLTSRIAALKGLIQFLTYIRYVMIVLWPVSLFIIALFVTGIVRGFDRSIIYSFLLGLTKVLIAFVVVIFVTVDLKRTFYF